MPKQYANRFANRFCCVLVHGRLLLALALALLDYYTTLRTALHYHRYAADYVGRARVHRAGSRVRGDVGVMVGLMVLGGVMGLVSMGVVGVMVGVMVLGGVMGLVSMASSRRPSRRPARRVTPPLRPFP